jgi:DNA-binding FadR family transcriptional regulator
VSAVRGILPFERLRPFDSAFHEALVRASENRDLIPALTTSERLATSSLVPDNVRSRFHALSAA